MCVHHVCLGMCVCVCASCLSWYVCVCWVCLCVFVCVGRGSLLQCCRGPVEEREREDGEEDDEEDDEDLRKPVPENMVFSASQPA